MHAETKDVVENVATIGCISHGPERQMMPTKKSTQDLPGKRNDVRWSRTDKNEREFLFEPKIEFFLVFPEKKKRKLSG